MKKKFMSVVLCLGLLLSLPGLSQAVSLQEKAYIPLGLTAGGGIADMAYDPVTKRVFTANEYLNNYVSVVNVDPSRTTPFFLEATVNTATRPEGLAVDVAGRRLFVACWDGGKVAVIDMDTLAYSEIITLPGAWKLAYDGNNGLYVEVFRGGLNKYTYSSKTKTWSRVANTSVGGISHRILYYKPENALVRLDHGSGQLQIWKVSGSSFSLVRFATYEYGGTLILGKIAASGKLYAGFYPAYIARIDLTTMAIEKQFPENLPADAIDCYPDESAQLLYYGGGGKARLHDLTNDLETETLLSNNSGGAPRYIETDQRYVFLGDSYGGIFVLFLDLTCP